MTKELRKIDEERGILRLTLVDERWYIKDATSPITGNPEYRYVPSVTWIAGHYPKGVQFYKWLAEHGWDESQAIKQAAGDKGSKVHLAVADLVAGKTIAIDAKYPNQSTGQDEELTPEEYACLMSFVDWYSQGEFEILKSEYVIWNDTVGYAGTVDLKVRRKADGAIGILDVKTGQNVWPEYELQVSAYKHADSETDVSFTGIIQVGYRRNKAGWKYTEVEDRFSLFLAAKQIWENECAGQQPLQKDYPLALTLPVSPEPKTEPPKKGRKVAVQSQD
jgi:hypothetical protein